jgi:DNA-binding MarR family transcriptional regulator
MGSYALMSNASAELLDALSRSVRACFARLRNAGDALHADLGITTAMRAIIEQVHDSPATVPDIARIKLTSRQNIQVLADELVGRGLAQFKRNPGHRRSPLLGLTADGRSAFRIMRQREYRLLTRLAGDLTEDALRTTLSTLDQVTAKLDELIAEGR